MADLPNYGRPPLIEVVVGVQFSPIQELHAAHIGAYWETIRHEFGKVQEQPPIAQVVESFEPGPHRRQVKVLDRPELPRTWFIDASENRLIQLQRDRFLFNWRKVKEEDEYPRFPEVQQRFLDYWAGFGSFLDERGMPPAEVDQCEVTYVNLMKQGRDWESFADMERLFTVFGWRTRSGFLPCPEGFRWALQFLLPEKRGRLHVDALPVLLPPADGPAIRLSLTARGAPYDNHGTPDLAGWFGMAREWIVRGFADLVAEQTDACWERRT